MDKFSLSTALAFFVSRVLIAYKSNEEFRKSIDNAVDKVMQCRITLAGKEDIKNEGREFLLAPYFTEICDDFAESWLEDEEQKEGDSNS